MKTIAITLELETLKRMSQVVPNGRFKNRSEFVRYAVKRCLDEIERLETEAREAEIVRKYHKQLNRDAAALIREQARL